MVPPEDLRLSIPRERDAPAGDVEAVVLLEKGVRVEVCFPAEGAPLLAVGRALELELARVGSSDGARALGKVIQRKDSTGLRTYEFLLGGRTREALSSLLDPRRSPRFRVEADEAVEATVTIPGDAEPFVTARVRDVSAGGLGLEIDWELESRLTEHSTLEIGLRLPEQVGEQRFMANIRGRSLGSGFVAYGLELVLGRGADRAAFDALAAYVATLATDGARVPRRSA